METTFEQKPWPIIDDARCNGCGLCERVCTCHALAMKGRKAVVARPWLCGYGGHCETVCPEQAISRPFQIVTHC